MTVQVKSADFRRAVTIATKVVERRNTIPVLETVRCRANGKLEITGTDLDIFLSASVAREPGKEAAFALMSPKPVGDALKHGGGETISLVPDADGHVELASGALSLKVGSLAADDFPNDTDRPLKTFFTATLSAAHMRALDRIASAISTEDTRYYLNGIYIHRLSGQTFRAAATDGHRLCCIDLELPDATDGFEDIIIPRKAVGLLRELGAKATGDVKIALGRAAPVNRDDSTAPTSTTLPRLSVAFDVPGVGIGMQVKPIDGTFPDYSRVIPQANDKTMIFDPADLRRALRAVSGHTKKMRAVKLALTPGTATFSAAYVGIDLALAIQIPCQHVHAGFEIGFNGNYLLDMVDAAAGEELALIASDAAGPVLVKNPADTAWIGVLMPMRV